AGTYFYSGERCVPQRDRADRAREIRHLLQILNAEIVGLHNDDSLAVIAAKAGVAMRQPHGRAARGTVHCCFPHSGQNFAPGGKNLPHSAQNFALAAGAATLDNRVWPMRFCAIATPAPKPTPMPALPPVFCAASSSDSAASNCVSLPRSPAMLMPMRWSMIFCNSSGSETLSTTNWLSSSPSAAKPGFDASAILAANAAWFAAISRKVMWLSAKTPAMRSTIMARNCGSRSATKYWARVPLTCLKKVRGSATLYAYLP